MKNLHFKFLLFVIFSCLTTGKLFSQALPDPGRDPMDVVLNANAQSINANAALTSFTDNNAPGKSIPAKKAHAYKNNSNQQLNSTHQPDRSISLNSYDILPMAGGGPVTTPAKPEFKNSELIQ